MTHWGWYWRIKKNHTPKDCCLWMNPLNSFELFKNKQRIKLIKESPARICFEIPLYNLKAILMDNDSLNVFYRQGSYIIPVEKKPCNYGGFYSFFRCPTCNARMRILYCKLGKYMCRKCANFGYYSQRLRPSERHIYMQLKIENYLKDCAGSIDRKPPWMKNRTFQKLRKRYINHDEKLFYARNKEARDWYGAMIDDVIQHYYSLNIPSGFSGLYDHKEEEDRVNLALSLLASDSL